MKYRSELVDKLVLLLSSGVSVGAACASVGIGRATYYRWRNKYRKFREKSDVAMLASEAVWIRMLHEILTAGDTQPSLKASILMFFLSRRYPNKWSRRNKNQLYLNYERPQDVRNFGKLPSF